MQKNHKTHLDKLKERQKSKGKDTIGSSGFQTQQTFFDARKQRTAMSQLDTTRSRTIDTADKSHLTMHQKLTLKTPYMVHQTVSQERTTDALRVNKPIMSP